MIDVLGHSSTQSGYTGLGTTWADRMKFDINFAPGASFMAQPVDLQPGIKGITTVLVRISKEKVVFLE